MDTVLGSVMLCRSVRAAHKQRLERQQQNLDPQEHGVDEPHRIHDVKGDRPQPADLPRGYHLVVARIGIRDAAAAGRHSSQPAFVKGLQEDEESPLFRDLLRIDQLLGAAELAVRDVVLHLRDHHRNDGPGLGDAGDLGNHARFDDLRLDLGKSGMHGPPS